MKIIPIHYTPSLPVTNWLAIESDANAMTELIAAQGGMFALHHSQVSDKPFHFFVLETEQLKDFIPELGSRFIINPKITGGDPKSLMWLDEACVSFPYRKDKRVLRATVINVEYDIPDQSQPNGLSHHEKRVERIIAQIFQHECQHGIGGNIFFSGPKNNK